jgi:predicted HAD superfamily Cof-like phosphohydrolase
MLTIKVNDVEKRYKNLTDADIKQIVTSEQKAGKYKTITELVCREEDLKAFREMDTRHMSPQQEMVKAFHKAFGILIHDKPTIPDIGTRILRYKLIKEELDELDEALYNNDIVKTADAIADLLYVVYGTAVSCGIDIEPIFNEVHRSNMTKGKLQENGKPEKLANYSPANLKPILDEQSK